MFEQLKEAFGKLKELWSGLEKATRVRLIVLVSVLVIGLLVFVNIINQKDYVVLYDNLEAYEAGEVYTKLKELNVDCKTAGSGTILIEKSQEANTRMQLASEGYPKSGLNYDLYMSNISFGTTDSEKKKYMIFQLQDRLQTTIKTLDSVENAIVTISVPDEDTFVFKEDQKDTTASVVVDLRSGVQLSQEQVRAIQQLIVSSVVGLNSNNISIIDTDMNILNFQGEQEMDVATNRFTLESQMRNQLQNQLLLMLEPVFGFQKVKVAVNVKLDFDQESTESTIYTPVIDDEGIARSVNELKENVDEASSSSSQEDGTNSINSNSESDKTSNTITYEINQTTKVMQKAQGAITDLSIAVIINNPDLDEAMITKVKEIVAFSTGIDQSLVNVSPMQFLGQDEIVKKIEEAMDYENNKFPIEITGDLVLGFTAILFTFILALMILKTFKKPKLKTAGVKNKKIENRKTLDDQISGPDEEELEANAEKNHQMLEELQEIKVDQNSEYYLKKEIDKFIDKRAEDVAQLLKNWIADE